MFWLKGILSALPLIALFIGFSSKGNVMAQENALYREPYRPQFHYSPPCQWMNDPNGMVYYQGEYHLFYQFNPKDIVHGPMYWGHAVSPDLIHWQTLPIALYPDDIGTIWSGSVVVDHANTSGLVPGGGLVAIFSYDNQSQGLAYSADKGRTWTKYAGNPVIPALAKDFRDPKVFWHEPSHHWVMVIAAGRELQIYTSPNLVEWEMTHQFSGGIMAGVWEVPDLFPLEIDGQIKWVFLASISQMAPAGGGGVRYFIGDFDGRTFTYDQTAPPLWLDYGPDNYAGTTWDNAPDNKRLYIGWMSNWQYAAATPTKRWRGATTLPREFRLVNTSEGIRLAQTPVSPSGEHRTLIGSWDNVMVDGPTVLENVNGRTLEIIAEFDALNAERFGLDLHLGAQSNARVVYNTKQEQLLISRSDQVAGSNINGFSPAFGVPLTVKAEPLRLHMFLDESSIEVFANDGVISLTSLIFGDPTAGGVGLFAQNGTVNLSHLEIYALSSVWSNPQSPDEFDFCS